MTAIIVPIIVLSIIGIVIFFLLLQNILNRAFHLDHVQGRHTPEKYGLAFSDLRIKTAHDKIIQLWDLNPQKNGPVIIGIHGWAHTAECLLPIARELVADWRIVLVNARNHGDSDDDKNVNMITYTEDLNAAVDFVETHIGRNIVLLGHSLGAAASLLCASRRPELIKAVISMASFSRLDRMLERGLVRKKVPKGLIKSIFNFLEIRVGERFSEISPVHTITLIENAILLLHGQSDQVVSVDELEELVSAAKRENIQVESMPGHDHNSLLRDRKTVTFIADFLKKYLGH